MGMSVVYGFLDLQPVRGPYQRCCLSFLAMDFKFGLFFCIRTVSVT
jgi:hypothetical protein